MPRVTTCETKRVKNLSSYSSENVKSFKCQACQEVFSTLLEFVEHEDDCRDNGGQPQPTVLLQERFLDLSLRKGNISKSQAEFMINEDIAANEKGNQDQHHHHDHKTCCSPSTSTQQTQQRPEDKHLERRLRKDVLDHQFFTIMDYMNQELGEPAGSRFTCSKCGYRASSSVDFIFHNHKFHNMYSCQFCHASFDDQNNLQVHIQSHHKRDYDFICNTCGKKFFNLCSMRKHRRKCMGLHNKAKNLKQRRELITKNGLGLEKVDMDTNYFFYCRIKDCSKVFRTVDLSSGMQRRGAHEQMHSTEDAYSRGAWG